MDDKITKILEYINSIVPIGDRCSNTIKECIDLIHQTLPVDNAGVFSKLSRYTAVSDDLSYVILCIERERSEVDASLKKIKDPKFTILVKAGRPSTQAIESEIRFTMQEVAEYEKKLIYFDNILSYLNHLEKCLDRSIWILKDLAAYIKK